MILCERQPQVNECEASKDRGGTTDGIAIPGPIKLDSHRGDKWNYHRKPEAGYHHDDQLPGVAPSPIRSKADRQSDFALSDSLICSAIMRFPTRRVGVQFTVAEATLTENRVVISFWKSVKEG